MSWRGGESWFHNFRPEAIPKERNTLSRNIALDSRTSLPKTVTKIMKSVFWDAPKETCECSFSSSKGASHQWGVLRARIQRASSCSALPYAYGEWDSPAYGSTTHGLKLFPCKSVSRRDITLRLTSCFPRHCSLYCFLRANKTKNGDGMDSNA